MIHFNNDLELRMDLATVHSSWRTACGVELWTLVELSPFYNPPLFFAPLFFAVVTNVSQRPINLLMQASAILILTYERGEIPTPPECLEWLSCPTDCQRGRAICLQRCQFKSVQLNGTEIQHAQLCRKKQNYKCFLSLLHISNKVLYSTNNNGMDFQ